MPSDVIARINRQPDYATDWHAHDVVMMLAPARGVFAVTDENLGRDRNVPPGAFYWIDAHCGHRSRAGAADQMHWVCYAPAELLHGAVRGARSGIAALSPAAERLLGLQRLLAEDDSATDTIGLEEDVSALLWRECVARIQAPDGAGRMSRDARLVERVNAELRNRLNEHPSLDLIARLCGVSRRHLTRLYRRQAGHTIHAQLNAMRMQRAAVLLATSGFTVMQVASEIGFDNPSHFARVFRNWHGVAPRVFRARTH
ncbi:MAG: AraC family transcriptional regulator [Acidihalobacter sp.]|uniref:helix-turn-helix transcriptional regulator n=1 Tax=Acidihalobacter sp. TaxID=1872108 RepID=UPI00307DB1F9